MNRIDPVHRKEDRHWYFWDVTQTRAFGPYESEQAARDDLGVYIDYVDGATQAPGRRICIGCQWAWFAVTVRCPRCGDRDGLECQSEGDSAWWYRLRIEHRSGGDRAAIHAAMYDPERARTALVVGVSAKGNQFSFEVPREAASWLPRAPTAR